MCDTFSLPDLSFPDIEFGANETRWNLNVLLYKGGAAARTDEVQKMIARGELGPPQISRLELVVKLHDEICTMLSGGAARDTVLHLVVVTRYFVGFADRANHELTLASVTDTYCAWAYSLVHRTRLKKAPSAAQRNPDRVPLSKRSAHAYGAAVGQLLNRVLERRTSVLELTRLRPAKPRKTASSVQAEKKSLADTFAFGHLLQDLCDELTFPKINGGDLPISLELRCGATLTCRGDKVGHRKTEQEIKLGERYSLVNLRMEAEFLMFIAQTGMNVAQAMRLEKRHFFYVSHLDGYQVKEHKARRQGAVFFEIFKSYKQHFERYLEWRRKFFPRSNFLFPFIVYEGSRRTVNFNAHRLRAICKRLAITFVSPSSLRNARVNWLLRQTADPELTAEMAQHAKKTLLGVYERPSLQRALVQTMRFWSRADPHAIRTDAVAPGGCTGTPKEVEQVPALAPKPDCIRPSGCLWCANYRDIDTFEYVWALTTFRHLKVIELSKAIPPKTDKNLPPAKLVVDRIDEKLRWFEYSSSVRCEWVSEAQARVAEGEFHHALLDEIAELEGES